MAASARRQLCPVASPRSTSSRVAGCSAGGAGWRSRCCRAARSSLAGNVEGTKAGGAEEDDGVLDALAAEAGERLLVLGHDAEDAAVGRS